MSNRNTDTSDAFGGFLFLIFVILPVFLSPFAWVTHIILCLETDRWGFLIAGALFFPIAIIHGFGHWFGFW